MDRRTFSRLLTAGAVTASMPALSAAAVYAATSDEKKRGPLTPKKTGTNTSFDSLKQINAGVLNIGYAEAGPADAPPVILLHGWPYDIHSFVDVAPLLAARGYRVIVPYLRGHGTTRFLSSETFRNAQQSVVALDIIALMDALKIKKAILAGFDSGVRRNSEHLESRNHL
jgi:predicted alpha/beta-fold hydrolase